MARKRVIVESPGTLCVLLVAPAPQTQGGVAVFADMVRKSLVSSKAILLQVGRDPQRRESFLAVAVRVLDTLLKMVYLVRSRSINVVHLNPSMNVKSLLRDGLLLLVLRLMGFRKAVVFFHGWDEIVASGVAHTEVMRRVLAWLLNGTGQVMVLSPDFGKTLVAMGVDSSRITVASTMFDGGIIMPFVPPGMGRSILFMSRFDARKGIYELLEAFLRIAADFPDTNLVFAGDGPEAPRLREKASVSAAAGRIKFCGYVTGEEKAMLLAGCALFVLPTYYPEGMPVALLEAMASGKPLLTAKAGGIKHIVCDPENGVVLDAVTVASVEVALRRMLSDKEYCAEAGRCNKTYAWENFEAKTVTAQIETIYHNVAHEKR